MISTHAPLAGRDFNADIKHVFIGAFQPTRPLRGATAVGSVCRTAEGIFQPTRPLRGATAVVLLLIHGITFQPTRPLRGATVYDNFYQMIKKISTHAPLAGRDDTQGSTLTRRSHNFNPRAPCGARPQGYKAALCYGWISTHAPLAGRDQTAPQERSYSIYFNPRAPCGARRSRKARSSDSTHFNPRAPCGARPFRRRDPARSALYFNPRAPCGARLPFFL